MNTVLLVLQREEPEWLKLLLFALFFVVPMLARLFKKAMNPQGEGQGGEDAQLDPRERRRRAREEQRRAEEEGEDLWRRLARGEEPDAPRPEPARAPVAPVLLEAEAEEATEDLTEPAPLAVLGEVSEPAEVSAVSLEQEVEPAPLSVLGEAKAMEAPAEVLRARFRLGRGELRRAVVLQEILAPPLALRGGG